MTLNIRSGQQSDVPGCVDILRAWAEETPWMPLSYPRCSMREFWSALFKTDFVWVAEVDGRVVGFCIRNDDNIGALYVASDLRNRGIGKRLLDMAKANRDWITVWAYDQNEHARRFYQREGLLEVSREVEEGSNLMNIEHRWVRPS
ncbi:MAG: GNAT family N-acetyltransferase [Pseudomonadota bacterium]